MKTHPKNQERVQGLQLHPEQTSPDTNPRRLFEVTVHCTDYRLMVFRLQAESEKAAENKAEKIAKRRKKSQWDFASRDLYAYAYPVHQIKEGGRHV